MTPPTDQVPLDQFKQVATDEPNSVVDLDRAEQVRLVALNQFRTYERLVEGLPTQELNYEIICAIAERAKELFKSKVYLVEPAEEPIEYPGKYPLGDPCKLPPIACIGHWRSMTEQREQGRGYSELTIVWFQHDFAFPIADEVLEELRDLDWQSVSTFSPVVDDGVIADEMSRMEQQMESGPLDFLSCACG